MCVSTPDVPTVPERQALKLPDNGAPADAAGSRRRRMAVLAGLITSPQGVLGSPSVASPSLGSVSPASTFFGAKLGG
jgi:hypothetical protein